MASDLILVIVGARQTGKTTILRQLYKDCLQHGNTAHFINLERLEYVALLNQAPENIFSILPLPPEGERATVFIDEIQYLDNPSNFLKLLFDEYRTRLKLVVTGSSAFYIDEKFTDSLAGRKRLFHLPTLSFSEFLLFKLREDLANLLPTRFSPDNFTAMSQLPLLQRDELVRLFIEFSRFGGYPAVVLATDEAEKLLILEDLINSSVKKDILESRIRHPEPYFMMIKMLAAQVGSLMNRNELSKSIGVSVQAIDNYLYVLQKSFHAVMIKPFHTNVRKELTKMPKLYFADMGMRNYLVGDFRDFRLRSDRGAFLENLCFRQLSTHVANEDICFWRTQDKTELDFVVLGQYGFEIKANPETFSPATYASFRERNPSISVDVVTFDNFAEKSTHRVWGAFGI
ncbi:MAG: ATP-binding protein [Nitrospirae bacterium]|nr:ATP-binding protein [Nitrospirota bacterium]